MRNKVLRTIDLLMEQKPILAPPLLSAVTDESSDQERQILSQRGSAGMVEMPSIQPDKELDDLDVIQKTVRQWAQKNFDKQEQNPDGFRNVVLYYKMAASYQQQAALSRQRTPTTHGTPGQAEPLMHGEQ